MNSRRKGREYGLQMLYAMEVGKQSFGSASSEVPGDEDFTEEAKHYGSLLAEKVMANMEDIDLKIKESSSNWDMERIAVVDKIIIRCSVAEMLFFKDIPIRVSINEAIDIAKKYSTENSSRFVNGVLDSIARQSSNLN